MFSYVKVLCVTTITKNITKKKFIKNVTFFFVASFFSIQTVAGSGYYGIECLYHIIIRNLKARLFFSSLSVRS